MIIEDMASSRLQNLLTKAGDIYGNKIRNFFRALRGASRFSSVLVPMEYGIRTYPEWMRIFSDRGLAIIEVRSIPHLTVEHGVFILERREDPAGRGQQHHPQEVAVPPVAHAP